MEVRELAASGARVMEQFRRAAAEKKEKENPRMAEVLVDEKLFPRRARAASPGRRGNGKTDNHQNWRNAGYSKMDFDIQNGLRGVRVCVGV